MRRTPPTRAALAAAVALATASAAAAAVDRGAATVCDRKSYQRTTLLHLASAKLGSVFADSRGMRQFEASGVSVGPRGQTAIIFDNAHTVGVVETDTLVPFAPRGRLLGRRRANQSQHEGVAWRTDGGEPTVLALVEAAADAAAGGALKARVDEYAVPAAGAPPPAGGAVRKCWVENFTLTHDNKGLEDIVYLGAGRALALCEGNRCMGGAAGRVPGHGRLLAMTYHPATPDAPCAWSVDRQIALPADAAFEDYAGLALSASGYMAVLSQQDAAVWVGRFDRDALAFPPAPDGQETRVFGLPRDTGCRATLCHAEGIDFLEDPAVRSPARVVVTVDKAKRGAPWPCVAGSESVHVLSLPRGAVPQADPESGDAGGDGEEGVDADGGGEAAL